MEDAIAKLFKKSSVSRGTKKKHKSPVNSYHPVEVGKQTYLIASHLLKS